jgi:hypothetical protein
MRISRLFATFPKAIAASSLTLCAAAALGGLNQAQAQTCNRGCSPNSRVIGIKSSRQFLMPNEIRRFKRRANAIANGYSAFIAPTPTATPTATATPSVSSYQGRYETSDSSPLLRVSASDTCAASGFTQATAISLDLVVLHTAGSTEIKGEHALTLPSGLATPTPTGQRFFGDADGSSFDLKGAYTATSVSGISCSTPVIETTYSGSSVTSTSAVIRRTDRIICPGTSVVDCRQVWEATVSKTAF